MKYFNFWGAHKWTSSVISNGMPPNGEDEMNEKKINVILKWLSKCHRNIKSIEMLLIFNIYFIFWYNLNIYNLDYESIISDWLEWRIGRCSFILFSYSFVRYLLLFFFNEKMRHTLCVYLILVCSREIWPQMYKSCTEIVLRHIRLQSPIFQISKIHSL